MRRFVLAIVAILTVTAMPALGAPAGPSGHDSRLDRELRERARLSRGSSRVILRMEPGVALGSADSAIRRVRGIVGRRLASVGGQVAYVRPRHAPRRPCRPDCLQRQRAPGDAPDPR